MKFLIVTFLTLQLSLGERLVLLSPSSSAFDERPEFHLSAKSENVVVKKGDQVDLTCRTSSPWHLCSWRAPGGDDAWCDRLSTARYAQSCHGDERIRFQRALPASANGSGDPPHEDCSITIVGVRGSDSGQWRCMVKESVRAEETWSERVEVTVASPYALEVMPLEEEGKNLWRTEEGRPVVRPSRPANESDTELICRAIGEGAVDPLLMWTVDGARVMQNRTKSWQEDHSSGERIMFLSFHLLDNVDILQHDSTLRCLSKQKFPNGTVMFESSVATKVDVLAEPVVRSSEEKSESNTGEIVAVVLIILVIALVLILICYAQKKKKWCYSKETKEPRRRPSDEEVGGVESARAVEERARLVAGEGEGVTARGSSNEFSVYSSGSARTQETSDNGGNSDSTATAATTAAVSAAVVQQRQRPTPIDLPSYNAGASAIAAAAAGINRNSSNSSSSGDHGLVGERSPVPPPSAPPMEEDEAPAPDRVFARNVSANSNASSVLPEDRLRQMIEARRLTSGGRNRSFTVQGDLEEQEGEAAAEAAQSRPLSVPIFRQFPLPGSGPAEGTPSTRGLSESLMSPRRPNIRRSNEYVKIKPRSMEVVTTTVQEEEQHQQQQPAAAAAAAAAAVNGAAAAQPPEEEGHYSSIDDLQFSLRGGHAGGLGPVTASVDVHNEMSFADEDTSDEDVDAGRGPSSPSDRPPPSETAL